jgi:hypothetical protein
MIIQRIIVTFFGKHPPYFLGHMFPQENVTLELNLSGTCYCHGNERLSDLNHLVWRKISYVETKADFSSNPLCTESNGFQNWYYCKVLACNTVENYRISYRPRAVHGTRTASLHGIQPRAVLELRLQRLLSCGIPRHTGSPVFWICAECQLSVILCFYYSHVKSITFLKWPLVSIHITWFWSLLQL